MMAYKIKITKSKPKGYGKGIIIHDDLNTQAWYDREKFKMKRGKTIKDTRKIGTKYVKENIRYEKRFRTEKQSQKYALELAKKLQKPVFDKGTRKYIVIKEK